MKENWLSFTSETISGEASGLTGIAAMIAIVAMIVIGVVACADAWQRRKTKR